jgi:Uncharacterized protein conserved in bacteria
MKISEHFSLSEFTYSRVAIAAGIDNTPPVEVVERLRILTIRLLEPVREHCATPLHIRSGYRCGLLNKRVGGVVNSQHLTGEAVDIYTPELTKVYDYLKSAEAPEYDQAIYYKKKNFIHLSLNTEGENRRQCFER